MSRSYTNSGKRSYHSPDDKHGFAYEANNLYVKNIPDDFDEEDFLKLFAPYGHIKSSAMKDNKLGKFGFICYEDPDRKDL